MEEARLVTYEADEQTPALWYAMQMWSNRDTSHIGQVIDAPGR